VTTTTTTTRKGTYQMLWDCPACGTRKLLGVDHRHCPNCGSPQEENLRYFPSKADRVATEFRGSEPDWECRHCGTPAGSEASFCPGCGAPRGDAATVFVRASIPSDQSETGEQAAQEWKQRQAELRARAAQPHARAEPPFTATVWTSAGASLWRLRGRWRLRWPRIVAWFKGIRHRPARLFVVALGVALLSLLFLAVCDRKVSVRVVGHSWTRVIPVERYTTVSESGWCSSIPSDARVYSRVSEIHHYNQIPDGQDCHTVPGSCYESCSNIDNGNGSFSEVCTQTCSSDRTECTTRYREEPVYADKCYYQVDRWIVHRNASKHGSGLTPEWPAEPSYSSCAGVSVGCERLGQRYGTYVVHFLDDRADERAESFECARSEQQWRALEVDARYIGKVSRLTGKLDCDELEPHSPQ
jgi:hypothetical protein